MSYRCGICGAHVPHGIPLRKVVRKRIEKKTVLCPKTGLMKERAYEQIDKETPACENCLRSVAAFQAIMQAMMNAKGRVYFGGELYYPGNGATD